MISRWSFPPASILTALMLALAQPADAQSGGSHASLPPGLDSAKAALEKYQNVMTAVQDGYLSTVACIVFPTPGHAGETEFPAGGMGVHLLNGALIGKPLDVTRPQVLIYEPIGDTLRLAAAEWFVPVAVSAQRPALFGKGFDGPMEGHAPIMPESLRHWDLHVWLWKENPAGMFASTNPAMECPETVNTVWMAPTH